MLLQPLVGILVLIGLAYAMSDSRRSIRWRTLAVGFGLQLTLAFLVLRTAAGEWFFRGAQSFFQGLIEIAKEAGRNVLGDGPLGFAEGPAVLGAIVLVTVVGALFLLEQGPSALRSWGAELAGLERGVLELDDGEGGPREWAQKEGLAPTTSEQDDRESGRGEWAEQAPVLAVLVAGPEFSLLPLVIASLGRATGLMEGRSGMAWTISRAKAR